MYDAPELPPPPYTSVMTTVEEAAWAGAAATATTPVRTRDDVTTRAPRRRRDRFWADMWRILTPVTDLAKAQHVNSWYAVEREGDHAPGGQWSRASKR
ncbi:hypothetical protein GCM10028799_32810 [Kribbella italica]